jgi:hypothetical protein
MPQQVTVTVDDDGQVHCSPNPVSVTKQDGLLSFTLLTPGYAFPSTGAVVLGAPSDQFPYPAWTVSSSLSALFDANSEKGQHDYTVTVLEVGTGKPIRHDPVIINNGDV